MYTIEDISVVTTYYNTPRLLETLLNTFRKFYDIPILVVNNSTYRKYTDAANVIIKKYKNVSMHTVGKNKGHAHGIHYGISWSKTPLVLFVDTDVKFKQKGLLEILLNLMDSDVYGAGRVINVNKDGFCRRPWLRGIPYLHPHCMLLNKNLYKLYPRAIRHGAPMIKAMKEIKRRKKHKLAHFASSKYYLHLWEGTNKKQWEGRKVNRPAIKLRRKL